MHDPNRLMKWVMLIVMVTLAIVVLYPPSEKLKGGIDLVGGTALLYEIDTTGLEPELQRDLSSRVMAILRERVDPQGQLNLEWRPVGNSRLEIRMPRPPREALARREAFNAAVDRLEELNLSRRAVEEALHAAAEAPDELYLRLERGIAARRPLIDALKQAYDDHQQAIAADDRAAIDVARDGYETALSNLLATSLPTARLTDLLELARGDAREEQLNRLRTEFPDYDATVGEEPGLITRVVGTYEAWARRKADLEDPSDLKRKLRGAGVLEFRILADRDPSEPTHTAHGTNAQLRQPISRYVEQLESFGPRQQRFEHYMWLPIEDPLRFMNVKDISEIEPIKDQPGRPIIHQYAGRWYVLAHAGSEYGMPPGTTGSGPRWKLVKAYADRDIMSGENVASFELDPRGGQLFGELTGNNVERQLCIVLDGAAVSHATIRGRITTRCQITGRFSPEQVNNLVRVLDAGSLPARLKERPLSEVTIGPSLGETNREMGLRAAVWGAITVVVFMLVYYGFVGGGVANIALCLNTLFVLAIMAMMQATFTLPGIAGLLLTVGMAVDANVLIFERFREERDRGVIFRKALNAGYDKAFSTIMDANITTLLTCIVLGFVGSEEVRGFAVVLGIGIATSMFTALVVTRLIFNTLISKGLLNDLRMMRLIRTPKIEWTGLWPTFAPISTAAVVLGMGLFVTLSAANREAIYDIEFLGGTSVQIDFHPGVSLTDEDVRQAITATGGDRASAVNWLRQAADALTAAALREADTPGRLIMESDSLTGDQIATLVRAAVDERIERDGIEVSGRRATFISLPGQLTLEQLREAVAASAESARQAADRLRTARVQAVGVQSGPEEAVQGPSYEVVTTEADQALVQEAIVAVLGDRLAIQRAISFALVADEMTTREEYFVVESDDHYLSDVLGGEATFDIRPWRGGVAVQVVLDDTEEPIPGAELSRRLREVSLQTQFQHLRSREPAVFPLGTPTRLADGQSGYRSFAVLAVDDTMIFDDDPVRWAETVAMEEVQLVKAALGSEKSLSKVVQFSAPIAGQTRNRAMMAIMLSLLGVVAYLWFRFGSKEYGLAAIVALVHDVSITLGLVAVSYYVHGTLVGKALLIDDFKIDLPMVAAVLTIIGYSLNDTIVVFDRIRENRGRVSALSESIINMSINQTMSRTVLTGITTFLVVGVLYVFGGQGVHGFSFAMLIGVVVGTYSSVAVAAPLLFKPRLLWAIMCLLVTLGAAGFVVYQTNPGAVRWVLAGIVVVLGILAARRSLTDPNRKYMQPTAAATS